MEHQLLFTHFLNTYFGAMVTRLLLALHVTPLNVYAPISNSCAMEVLCVIFLTVMFLLVRTNLSVEQPGIAQHLAETFYEFVEDQGEQVIGHGYERYMAYIGGLAAFILTCNLMGLIPGLESPTASVVVPLGVALPTFLYYNWYGVRAQGPVGYLKHFFGPIPWMSPFMFLIEIVSHLARILSLTVRLYANMFAGDLLTMVFFSLIPIGVPVVFLGLHLFVSLIQAYVFMLLTMIYLANATAQEH